ncbi:MAG: MFS transporter [Candidatus Thorarchaeota archaeon]
MIENELSSDWAALKSVYYSAIFCSLGFFLVRFLIPIIAYTLMGVSATEVALVFSMLTLGTAAFSPVAGKAAKRGRRRESIALGASVRAIAYFGMTAAIILNSIELLVVNSLVWGLGAAFYRVGSDAEISERVIRDNRAEAFGRRESFSATGSVVGAFAGFTIMYSIGLEAVFLFFAVMNILGGLVVIRHRPPLEPQKEITLLPSVRKAVGAGIVALVIAASLDTFIAALLSPFVEIFILHNYPGLDFFVLALVYLPAGIISGLFGAPLGKYADKRNKVRIVSVAVFVGAIGMLILAFVPVIFPVAWNGLLAIAILFTIGSVAGVMAYTVMSSVLGTAYEGRAGEGFGMFEAAMGLSRFSAPLVGGLLWDFIDPVVPFLFVGLSGFLLIPIYIHGMRQYEQAIALRDETPPVNDAQEL